MKATIPVRNSVAWRGAFAVRRLARNLSPRPTTYRYRPLWATYEGFWASDSEATASLDPHETALLVESRGWEMLSRQCGWRSVLHRARPLIVGEPNGVATA